MSWLTNVFTRNKSLESSMTFDFDGLELRERAYLKSMALEVCIGFIARTVAQSDFRISQGGKRVYDDWHYTLNVRPNSDQSATDFWQRAITKLIYDNKLLIVPHKSDLLIADSFNRKEFAVYPDTFTNVTVKEFTFNRSFKMDQVIYIEYNNEKLATFMSGLFDDYTNLFSRMIETSMFSNQIRATAGLETTQKLDDASMSNLQNFINKMFTSFKTKSFAIVPKLKGFEYNEITNGTNSGRSIEDITRISDKAVESVAQLLGVPIALVRGDLSDYETAIKAYDKFCCSPLLKKISDELNVKIIEKRDYMNGRKIEVVGIALQSPLDKLMHLDKGVASGVLTPNEARRFMDLEPSDDPAMDKHYITKNYQEAEHTSKGGEEENANET